MILRTELRITSDNLQIYFVKYEYVTSISVSIYEDVTVHVNNTYVVLFSVVLLYKHKKCVHTHSNDDPMCVCDYSVRRRN